VCRRRTHIGILWDAIRISSVAINPTTGNSTLTRLPSIDRITEEPGAAMKNHTAVGVLLCQLAIAVLLGTNAPNAVLAGEVIDPANATTQAGNPLLWYHLRLLDVEGKGWTETKSFFDRLPAKAEKIVRGPVWSLSRHSAGMCVRFETDAVEIHARWTLTSNRLAMTHMPATGVSGLDLYVKLENGRWRWLAVGQPKAQTNTVRLTAGIPKGRREYMLYLPLYNGVSSVEIGIPRANLLAKADARKPNRQKPIVFYGTSITHGCCASRPGMVHTAILGRRLDHPVVNLGFSGNGRMELELAHLLSELDAAVYVIDCLPNTTAPHVAERTEPLVRALRKARPHTPILLVEDRSYADSFLVTSKRLRNAESRKALKKAYDRLIADGVKQLYYLTGEALLGDDGEGTVDSSHPTDLGFMRQADAFEAVLRPILKSTKH
jgi:hypothetical protein